ncbi:MAG: hypothetical protein R3A48_10815 [Polyangiales bacterium]
MTITDRTVCFTTDGSMPELQNGMCVGATTARLPADHRVRIDCGAETSATTIRGVKLAFDWPATDGVIVQTVAGNFTSTARSPSPTPTTAYPATWTAAPPSRTPTRPTRT